MSESKVCKYPPCGKTFYSQGSTAHINWKRQRYCSRICGISHYADLRHKERVKRSQNRIQEVSESVQIKQQGLGNMSVRNHQDPPRMKKIPFWLLYPKGWEKVAERVCEKNWRAQYIPGTPLK